MNICPFCKNDLLTQKHMPGAECYRSYFIFDQNNKITYIGITLEVDGIEYTLRTGYFGTKIDLFLIGNLISLTNIKYSYLNQMVSIESAKDLIKKLLKLKIYD